MRFAPWLLSTLLPFGAQAAEPAKPKSPPHRWTAAELHALDELEARAYAAYPRRRDVPLRYVNISDGEVREIQGIAAKRKLTELVNIAPVVTGCPCEEGANCTEQTYLVSEFNGRPVGLQLSRVRNRWDVSRVQKWWLEYSAVLAREDVMTRLDFENARHLKLLEFPQCATAARAEPQKTSDLTTAARK